MGIRRPGQVIALLVGTALAMSGCDSGSREGADSLGEPSGAASPSSSSGEQPAGEPAETPPADPSADPGTMTVAVYYLVDLPRVGPRLQREFRRVPKTGSPARAAVEAMLHLKALDRDYQSLWPTSTRVIGVDTSGDLTTVDLSREASGGNAGAAFEGTSLQQLVYTVTAAAPAAKRVQLLVEGKKVESLWGHVDAADPQKRADHTRTLAPVSISSPNEGTTVGGTFTLSGTATVFEANVQWRVTRGCPPDVTCVGDKPVYRSGFVTASAGAPARGTWSVEITVPEEVFETAGFIEITAFEESAEDGAEIYNDTKVVRVTR